MYCNITLIVLAISKDKGCIQASYVFVLYIYLRNRCEYIGAILIIRHHLREHTIAKCLQRVGDICHGLNSYTFLLIRLKLCLYRALKHKMRSFQRIIQPYLPNQLKRVGDGLIYERIIWASSLFSSSCDHLIILLYEFRTAWRI